MKKHGIQAVFSGRKGGCSLPPFDGLNVGFGLGDTPTRVNKNIKTLCATAVMPMPHRSKQVHGVSALWCSGKGMHHDYAADILLTQEKNCAVAVQTADCVPILLAHPATGIVAAVHAGWRGTAKNIVFHACLAMQSRGAVASEIVASIGPAIGSCCFVIDKMTFQLLDQSMPLPMHASLPLTANLPEINRQQLIAAGLASASIERMSPCTCCHHEHFFSYRHDQGTTGRQLSMVCTAG